MEMLCLSAALIVGGITFMLTMSAQSKNSDGRVQTAGAAAALVALLTALSLIPIDAILEYVANVQWFESLGYRETITTITANHWNFLGGGFIFGLIFSLGTLLSIAPALPKTTKFYAVGWAIAVTIGGVLVFSGIDSEYLKWKHSVAWGVSDPVLHRDYGFYTFKMPFYNEFKSVIAYVAASLLVLTVLAFTAVQERDTKPTLIVAVERLFTLSVLFVALYLSAFFFLKPHNSMVDLNDDLINGADALDVAIHFPAAFGWMNFFSFIAGTTLTYFVATFFGHYDRTNDHYKSWTWLVAFIGGCAGFAASVVLNHSPILSVIIPAISILLIATGLRALVVSFIKNETINLGSKRSMFSMGVTLTVILVALFTPSVYEQKVIRPSAVSVQREYLNYQIEGTRYAYNLSTSLSDVGVQEESIAFTDTATPQTYQANDMTLKNARSADYNLVNSYADSALSGENIYQFDDTDLIVGIDPETGEEAVFMVSVRNVNQNNIPENLQKWENHASYTNGFCYVLNRINDVTPENTPEFLIQNTKDCIDGNYPAGFELTHPEHYFSDGQGFEWILTGARYEDKGNGDFDGVVEYTAGIDENKNARRTVYEGTDGIIIGSLSQRVIWANKFDSKILWSNLIDSDTRLHYRTNVIDRVQALLPSDDFVTGYDPYPAFYNGTMYWIVDIMSTARIPYSEKAYNTSDFDTNEKLKEDDFNYARPVAKAVVDHYNGTVVFYIMEEDPIVKTWEKILPNFFTPHSEIPQWLLNQLRYPEDMYLLQAEKLAQYHVTDVRAFYSERDLWKRPSEKTTTDGDQDDKVVPRYVMAHIPGQEGVEPILIMPFVTKKDNLVAWVAATMDYNDYGQLHIIGFPRESQLLGPSLAESEINNNTVIAQIIRLHNQETSQILFGNLIMMPITDPQTLETSVVYLKPIYLSANVSGESKKKMPKLLMVVLVNGRGNVLVADNIEEVLELLYTRGFKADTNNYNPTISIEETSQPDVTQPTTPNIGEPGVIIPLTGDAAIDALRYMQAAENCLAETDESGAIRPNWVCYDENMQALQTILEAAAGTPTPSAQ